MNKLYSSLSPKNFKMLSVAFCLTGDALIFGYIYHKFTSSYKVFERILFTMIESQGVDSSMVDKLFFEEQFFLATNVLEIMLVLIILFHLVNYTFFLRGKKFAGMYIKLYAWIAGVGCSLSSLGLFFGNIIWGLGFLVQGVVYLMVAVGFKHFPLNQKQEPQT